MAETTKIKAQNLALMDEIEFLKHKIKEYQTNLQQLEAENKLQKTNIIYTNKEYVWDICDIKLKCDECDNMVVNVTTLNTHINKHTSKVVYIRQNTNTSKSYIFANGHCTNKELYLILVWDNLNNGLKGDVHRITIKCQLCAFCALRHTNLSSKKNNKKNRIPFR